MWTEDEGRNDQFRFGVSMERGAGFANKGLVAAEFARRENVGHKSDNFDEITKEIERMLATLQFGSITLVVQDGKIIQLEKKEKVRMR